MSESVITLQLDDDLLFLKQPPVNLKIKTMHIPKKHPAFSFLMPFIFCMLHISAAAAASSEEIVFYKYNNFSDGGSKTKVPPDSNSLKQALADFIKKADSGKYIDVIAYYDTNFASVRVADDGRFIKMDYTQMVNFWKTIAGRQGAAVSLTQKTIVAQSTTIHYIEILGDTAYILLTRVKDLGHGPEPMFYNLIWVYKNNKWYLFREIVHQRTAPNFH